MGIGVAILSNGTVPEPFHDGQERNGSVKKGTAAYHCLPVVLWFVDMPLSPFSNGHRRSNE
jgi:hypothetical protein